VKLRDLPVKNLTAHPYRGLSVQDVDCAFDVDSIASYLIGRDAYRRTDFLLLNNLEGEWALVAVQKASEEPLFAPIVAVRVLAARSEVLMVNSPATDVGNASALADVAAANEHPGVLAYAVRGRFEHINFIWRPEPLVFKVAEVVPPTPPKLLAMAIQAVAFDEDLPPIRFELDAVNIDAIAAENEAAAYLLPCRGSGIDLPGEVAFLDTRPPPRDDWLLIGCERSLQFHREFYSAEAPSRIDICPRARAATGEDAGAVLAKCCMLERGIAVEGDVAVVPWGSNLDEVRLAIRRLVGIGNVSSLGST